MTALALAVETAQDVVDYAATEIYLRGIDADPLDDDTLSMLDDIEARNELQLAQDAEREQWS